MTEIEKLRLQRDAIDGKIAAAHKKELNDSLRSSFARLADESLPVDEILLKVLGNTRTIPREELPKFAERLAEILKVYSD